jgi:hypothetical protein
MIYIILFKSIKINLRFISKYYRLYLNSPIIFLYFILISYMYILKIKFYVINNLNQFFFKHLFENSLLLISLLTYFFLFKVHFYRIINLIHYLNNIKFLIKIPIFLLFTIYKNKQVKNKYFSRLFIYLYPRNFYF